ncbi:hypothetical protein [Aliidiomarina quisquiliarum]|uniref:hypothetical protein n=1 Tax=Aliidiomarina quisquiliarum TaxID=2938947 RepID=UPI00208F0CBF|nr:hypothetical protein [Aliidiomarina quisquiliarum]MCO4320759.1 hypothetical protein [Aliidiomarina quisquiliarum]
MAIINCPGCSKRVSDKAGACDHCGFLLSGQDTDSLARQAQIQRKQLLNKLTSQQMTAMLLFVVGIAAAFYDWAEEGAMPNFLVDTMFTPSVLKIIGFSIMGLGLAWYMITRGRIYNLKRKR